MAIHLEREGLTAGVYKKPSSSPAIRHLSDFHPTRVNTHEAIDISVDADRWMASDLVTLDRLVRESTD
ncbi:hypothetical protein A3D07_00870 [Candidatus Curtissbacteria bacterium RIFCSPHIGHO2_02_FULL_42_15]|uniref:Uncharacterized protein n=1 Tax=Candidatus Curtissbacteria bacterium RIFCSPHIGHO2_02_FULL_42_15 TaxID=1797716 RepID=A0A1F5GEX1_9BACT|nr:MAG: hypothetical protein A3D07_00870 [Candidatus Curtissbacteria bacterium RIFCSPHIGHO2_02_FULL_42_15]